MPYEAIERARHFFVFCDAHSELFASSGRGRLPFLRPPRYRFRQLSTVDSMTMDSPRRVLSVVSCGLLLVSMSAARFVAAPHRAPASGQGEREACTLLAAGDASTAL